MRRIRAGYRRFVYTRTGYVLLGFILLGVSLPNMLKAGMDRLNMALLCGGCALLLFRAYILLTSKAQPPPERS